MALEKWISRQVVPVAPVASGANKPQTWKSLADQEGRLWPAAAICLGANVIYGLAGGGRIVRSENVRAIARPPSGFAMQMNKTADN